MNNLAHKFRTQTLWYACIDPTPVGPVWLAASPNGLVAVDLTANGDGFVNALRARYGAALLEDMDKVQDAARQIGEYLAGQRQSFDLPIDWAVMTDFQAVVLKETAAIPYGETTTYQELARRVGKPKGARAVGRAEATNPVPLVLPCHRVLGQDGSLRGYGTGQGLKTKAWLLKFEQDRCKSP
jgi:methylated-DNA-[protein]-cysteine S-methyltransferase